MPRLRLSNFVPESPSAARSAEIEADDCSRADAAGLDLKAAERRRKELRVMLAHVRDVAVDDLSGSVYQPFGAGLNFPHVASVALRRCRSHRRSPRCGCRQARSGE